MKNKLVHLGIITIFCGLYFLVATISMINSVEFFDLAHNGVMNWSLAIGFELGAAASLAAIVILDKTNRAMVWFLFLLLTAFQMMANSYHAFVNLEAYMGWIELFGLEEMEPLVQKRILSIVSGAVLPVVALGFIKSLVDYIRPENAQTKPTETVGDLLTKKEVVPVQTPQPSPQIIKAQKEQIERIKSKTPVPEPEVKIIEKIVEKEVPVEVEKIVEKIVEKEVIKEVPQAPPVVKNITEGPRTAGPERAITEAIKKQREEDEIANPVDDTEREVDVTIKDNITYVKTRKKE